MRRSDHFAWPDEAYDTVRLLWGKESASSIADRLSAEYGHPVSRNAVIGKAHRFGLTPQRVVQTRPSGWWTKPGALAVLSAGVVLGKSGAEIAEDVSAVVGFTVSRSAVTSKAALMGTPVRRSEREHRVKVKRPVERRIPPILKPRAAPKPVVDLAPPALMLSVMQISDGQCHYPYGDPKQPGFGYCGHSVKEGSSYCQHHHARVWQPLTAKQKKTGYGFSLAPNGLPAKRKPIFEAA